jgi:hypothetical protein
LRKGTAAEERETRNYKLFIGVMGLVFGEDWGKDKRFKKDE